MPHHRDRLHPERLRHTRASDTITAHNTGCTTSTRSKPPPPRTASTTEQSTNGSNASAHSANRCANTGEDSSNPAPIPTHCDP
ncbi:hypothetical protein GCM10018952_19480 [Streptosporangium vulgare]